MDIGEAVKECERLWSKQPHLLWNNNKLVVTKLEEEEDFIHCGEVEISHCYQYILRGIFGRRLQCDLSHSLSFWVIFYIVGGRRSVYRKYRFIDEMGNHWGASGSPVFKN